MYKFRILLTLAVFSYLTGCIPVQKKLSVEIFETSAAGNKLKRLNSLTARDGDIPVTVHPEKKFQTITGFGGSFTEASAYLLNKISRKNRNLILSAYFGEEGSRYSLMRTHINSCDFSLGHYSYAPVPDDLELKNFSIEEDRDDIIPLIRDAMKHSKEGFKIIASPWTAPPWMKDNNDWRGGKLLPSFHETWALFFSKYLTAYKQEGIDIWGITAENEPLGCGNNWESMIFTPREMMDFVNQHLGPRLQKDGHTVKILAYDQNRGKPLEEWAGVIYRDKTSSRYFDGFAVHWYGSTFDYFPQSLNFTHKMAPEKHLIQTEACVDSEVPRWRDDAWYWSEEATDWGWDWAPAEEKFLHPRYVPVFRYARDIIGCMNNWVDGWVDWNIVLDRQGGPNWFKNWCVAPVIVDPGKDEVYFTPLYYTLAHFSRFIRPEAVRIGCENPDASLLITAAQNPDGTIAVVILNMAPLSKVIRLQIAERSVGAAISPRALQTIVVRP